MTTMMNDLQNNERLSLLNKCLQQGAVDLADVASLAQNTSAKLASLNDYTSIKEMATTVFPMWNQVQRMDRPNGPNHNQIMDEIGAGWRSKSYMPEAPDDETRADAAATSAARALAILCRLMAERFEMACQTGESAPSNVA